MISEFFRTLFSFEAKGWIPFVLAILLLMWFLIYKQSQKKYYVQFKNGLIFSAKTVWYEFSWFQMMEVNTSNLVAVYKKLIELKHEPESVLNKKMSDYLFAKIDTNRLSSVFEIYELYESLKNEDKVQGNYLYRKMCFFLNSYDEKLLIVDLNINKELYNYTFLRDFHESVKNFESDDAKSFMNFIRIYSGSIYKKLDIIREYMSEENKMNRYVDAREEFLGFTKISELPKMWKMFHIDLEKSCGSRFQKVIDCDLREKVSQRLLQVIDESDVLNGLMGLKNLKELFDILSEYIILQDLMDLYLKITDPDFTKVNPEN